MSDEQTATESTRGATRRMDLLERRLWHGGLIAALLFIGIATLIAGHRRPRVVVMAGHAGCMMRPWMQGPPPWDGPEGYCRHGWGPGSWSETPRNPYGPREQQPAQPAPEQR